MKKIIVLAIICLFAGCTSSRYHGESYNDQPYHGESYYDRPYHDHEARN